MATTGTGAVLGAGAFTYEVSGDDWGNLPGGWSYKEATAVAVDSRDNAYVFNRGEHPMIVLDRDGNLVREWGHGVFSNPHGVSAGPDDSIYCVDNADHTVRKFTPEGKLMMTLGTKDRPAAVMSGEPFNAPTHLAVDPRNGDMYVADGYGNARVHKYDPDGRLLFSWGESGTDPGEFSIVHNITVDRDGWVYVADRENRRVQVFDWNGKFETQWGNLSRAAAICVDQGDDQRVYVGEYFAGISSNEIGPRLGPRVTEGRRDLLERDRAAAGSEGDRLRPERHRSGKVGRPADGSRTGKVLLPAWYGGRLARGHLRGRGAVDRDRLFHGPSSRATLAPEAGQEERLTARPVQEHGMRPDRSRFADGRSPCCFRGKVSGQDPGDRLG